MQMKTYDSMVVGSGVSGLTATLLLALTGQRVLLLEKEPRIGGSLCRFTRRGLSFDTGFHFTGGLGTGGLLNRMLSVLGIAEAVEPRFLSERKAHRFVFEAEGRTFDMPSGVQAWRRTLKEEFPGEAVAVDRYFDLVEGVRAQTPSMDLQRIGETLPRSEMEFVSLKTVLDGITGNALLKGILCALGMCYGVKPAEISFASHSRVCFDLYESTARLVDGGESLIRAFEQAFRALEVTVACGTWIEECRDVTDDRVGCFVLNTGETVTAGATVLTIHPRHVLQLLPRRNLSKAFVDRVESFEPSSGFFALYGELEDDPDAGPDLETSIVSLFPCADFDQMLDPAFTGERGVVICAHRDAAGGVGRQAITAFEPSFFEQVAPWKDTLTGHRPEGYRAYKAARAAALVRHLSRYDRGFGERFRVLDTASMLTFRDYLHSPEGAAYGIKQKIGQYNLIGKLPVRNLFAAGQSSLLPGVAGAMMSSFIVVRQVVGKEFLNGFVSGRLCS
jgi:phytoene dehydrogenase-like protein